MHTYINNTSMYAALLKKKHRCASFKSFPSPGCFGWWKYHGLILKKMSWCQPCGCPGKPHEWVRRLQPRQPLARLLLQRDGPRPGFCWAQHKQGSIRKGENYDLFLPPGLLKAEYHGCLNASNYMFVFSFQLVQGSCWDTTQVHFKRIQVMHNSLHPMRNCTDLKKKKNLVTFSDRNIPTKCFLLKYWRPKDQWFKQ